MSDALGWDPSREFWELAYASGDHVEHWEPSAVAGGETRSYLGGGHDFKRWRGARIVDLGCGAGDLARRVAAETGCRVLAVDLSVAALTTARRRDRVGSKPGALCCVGRVAGLPFADAQFDLALDRGCLHALSGRGRRRYAREVARVLRPGGTWLIEGAAADDEEAGLFALDEERFEHDLAPLGFRTRSTGSSRLVSKARDLEARWRWLVLA